MQKPRKVFRTLVSFVCLSVLFFVSCDNSNTDEPVKEKTTEPVKEKTAEPVKEKTAEPISVMQPFFVISNSTSIKLTSEEENDVGALRKNEVRQAQELVLQRRNNQYFEGQIEELKQELQLKQELMRLKLYFFCHVIVHLVLLIAFFLYLLLRKPKTQPSFTSDNGRCRRCGGELIDESGSRVCKDCRAKY